MKLLLLIAIILALVSSTISCIPTQPPTLAQPPTPIPSQLEPASPAPTPTVNLPVHRANIRLAISQDTVYYVVSGETTEDIFNSVETNGPDYDIMTKGGFASGLTETDSSYEWESLDYGTYCELQSVDINMRIVVTLPRHTTPQALSDLQLSRWKDYAEGVAVHEQTHVDIYIDRIEAFKIKVESFPEKFSDCDSLQSSLELAWESEQTLADQEQDAFHLAEEQLSQRLKQPVQLQIDQNELELGQLQNKLDSLSSEIEALNLDIENIEHSTLPYETRMDAIQNQYPDLALPPVIFNEYEELRAELNKLIDLLNGLITSVNNLGQQYNQTIEEFNRLVDQTNQLNDELAWVLG